METKWYLGKKRLLKLADHLINKKCFLDKFNFTRFIHVEDCGTSGCALGECPGLFPKYWTFDSIPSMRFLGLKEDDLINEMESASQFFGINRTESLVLFSPQIINHEDPDDVTILPDGLTTFSLAAGVKAKTVGKNILRFVKWKDKQLNIG